MSRPTACSGKGRRVIVAGAVGAVVAAASLAGASGAAAANDYLQFSLDGVTYSSAVAGPVFTEALQYVPGGSSSSSVWVRNNGEDPAFLSAGAAMTRSEPELTGYIGLRAGRLPDLSTRTSLGAEGSCTDVPQVWNLGAGEELKLDFVADLSTDAPNNTMNRTADFDLLFLLGSRESGPRQACAALAPPGQPAGPGGGPDSPASPVSAGGDTGAGADTGAGTDTRSATPVILAGSGARPGNAPGGVQTAAAPGGVQAGTKPAPAEGSPRAEVPASPRDVVQAGFQSTVEPIIRSLAGTLLIAMSVALTAAAVLRLRNRQA